MEFVKREEVSFFFFFFSVCFSRENRRQVVALQGP